MIFTPIFFLIMGYSLMYIIGRPVIQFTTSSLRLFLLSDIPKYEKKTQPSAKGMSISELEEKRKTIELEGENIPSSKIDYPRSGYQYGQVDVASVNLNVPLYYGDSDDILREGAGQYMGSVYPGEHGTTLIGGHNSSEFGKLSAVKITDKINISTSYGEYVYQVYETKILDKNAKLISQLLVQKQQGKLILYTCYPVDSIGMTDQRLFILGDLIKGPMIQPDK
ncbi:MAG: class D sortase [Enterococcus hirae]|nr:class D sortase [Enterococcus hirae]